MIVLSFVRWMFGHIIFLLFAFCPELIERFKFGHPKQERCQRSVEREISIFGLFCQIQKDVVYRGGEFVMISVGATLSRI